MLLRYFLMIVIITLTSNNTVIATAQDEHTEKNIFHGEPDTTQLLRVQDYLV